MIVVNVAGQGFLMILCYCLISGRRLDWRLKVEFVDDKGAVEFEKHGVGREVHFPLRLT